MNFLKSFRYYKIILLLSTILFFVPISFAKHTGLINITQESYISEILKLQVNHVEQIGSFLQYLVQVVNKRKLNVAKKKEFFAWIKYHQKVILEFESRFEKQGIHLYTDEFYSLMLNLNLFTNHILKSVNNKLDNLGDFNFYKDTKCIKEINLEVLQELSVENIKSIKELKKSVNSIGLTTINKVTRALDLLNDKYSITTILEHSPLILLTATTGIYLTPQRYFKNIPILKNIKELIGTYICTDKEAFDQLDEKQKAVLSRHPEQGIANLFNIVDSSMLKALSILSTAYMTNTPLSPYTKMVKDIIRNQWDKLKGFEVEDIISRGQIIKDITLDDEKLIGLDSQIEELYNLVRYVVDPEKYDRSNSNLDKGILLVGPSRNGKTYAARALCGTLNRAMKEKGYNSRFAFKELKPGDIKWSFEGIKSIIDQARKDAPCILFIDEIHNLPLQTKEAGGDLLTQFLTGMSGVNNENDARHQMIILGATNQPELLDTALLQPGRFGNIIYFEKPNYQNRKKYFDIMLKNSAVDVSKIDIDSLAKQTQGCSYGDLELIIKGTRFKACTYSKNIVQDNIQEQINKHVYKLRAEFNVTDQEKKHLAAHQAGHAFMYALLKPNQELQLVTIRGRWRKIQEGRIWDDKERKAIYDSKSTKYGGLFTYLPNELVDIQDTDQKIKMAKIKLAGILAEKILLGSPGYTHQYKFKQNAFHNNDKGKALNYIKSIVFDGMSQEIMPKEIKNNLEIKAYNMLNDLEKETLEILNNNRDILEKLAKELEVKLTLTFDEIKEIIDIK